MDKIEQAREALAAKGREVGFLSIEDIDEVFASLSTSTPVDGVEPVAQLIKGLRHAASARSDRLQQTQAIDNAIAFLSALASPEAEARLRERVAELEQIIHQLRTSQPDNFAVSEQWKNRVEAAEARLAQAEGGPAVTEANPLEPTIAFVARMCWRSDPPNANKPFTERERFSAIKHHPTIKHYGQDHAKLAALEAALHPQSAAGEEGKP